MEIEETVLKLKEEGLTDIMVRCRLDLTQGKLNYIKKNLRDQGFVLSSRVSKGLYIKNKDKIIELHNQGKKNREIATTIGIKEATLQSYKKRIRAEGIYLKIKSGRPKLFMV